MVHLAKKSVFTGDSRFDDCTWRDSTIFTSDGPWRATLRAGSMIEDDILVTGNFGSKAKENFGMMQAFLKNMVKMAVNVYGILGWLV